MSARQAARTRVTAGWASLVLVAGVLALFAPQAARADSSPPTASAGPVSVAADALPTVQINGVVWSQVVVGNTVYVAGSFTRARPAGSAAGQDETVRNNLLAYDIRTGNLITSFAPSLNAQALVVKASPDGSRIYVGGDFTQADGQSRNRVAAYDTATGALVAGFAPSVNSQVRAIAVTADTVYLGGGLSAVGGVSRTRLAAVSASNGALLPWAPVPGVGPTSGNRNGSTATSNAVMALVVTGGGDQVVASGRFDSMNGAKNTGIAALDPVTAGSRPFAVNQSITNQGVNSAIYSLSTDAAGTTVYGSGYDYYGPGNLEGTFAANAGGGTLIEVNDCHGDTYSTFPMNGLLYVASHTHNCESIGGSIEQSPRVERGATAYTLTPTTVVRWGTNVNWVGKPAGYQVAFNPDISAGTYTGQSQRAWSVTGDGTYLSYGGEFPRVNGSAQQGLVRFAMPSAAPNKVGPLAGGFTATVVSPSPGVARISWPETWDYDSEYLTYRVYRDDASTLIFTTTRGSRWWNLERAGYADVGVSGAHQYRVTASDPFGNTVATPWTTFTVPAGSATARSYVAAVQADGATDHWSLGGASGTGYADTGGDDLNVGTGVVPGAAGAISGDPDTAYTFDGTSSGYAAEQSRVQAPNTFTAEAWFRTTSLSGGKIIGFGNANSGTSTTYDRHVYMDTAGRVIFGVNWLNNPRTISSGTGFNDGNYHHVVATLSNGGMQLYVDGVLRAGNSQVVAGPNYYGYWRIGGDATWSGSGWFNGQIDEVAVYPTVLTAQQVAGHYALRNGGGPANTPPNASFTHSETGLATAVDASGSSDPGGSIASYAWNFGDGATASGTTATASHTYTGQGSYTVTLTVTDDQGAVGTSTASVVVTDPTAAHPPTAAFTSATSGLTAAVDGNGSTDPDGDVLSYAWNFGDGSTDTGTGAAPSHTYASGGTWTVSLTVSDPGGNTDTVSHPVIVTDPNGPPVVARDEWNRGVTGGLGTADVGGPWTAISNAAQQSVSGGFAAMTTNVANQNTGSSLGASQTGVDIRTTVAVTGTLTGNGTYVYVGGRRVAANQEYRVRVRFLADGRVALALSRVSSSESFPAGEVIVPGLTYAAGATLDVHVQVYGTGTTQIRGTVWPAGQTEPAKAQLSFADTTAALQAGGGLSLLVHRPTGTTAVTTVRFTSYTVTAVP